MPEPVEGGGKPIGESISDLLETYEPNFVIYESSDASTAIDDPTSVIITEDTTFYIEPGAFPGQEEDGPGGMVEEG